MRKGRREEKIMKEKGERKMRKGRREEKIIKEKGK